jgi:hypothetical protein
MLKHIKHILGVLLAFILGFAVILVAPPYIGGVYYSLCGSHEAEQIWLDRCILRIKIARDITPDPELKKILDYAATKYNKIGAWNVMVFPLVAFTDEKVWGCNVPWCPGITIDPEVTHYPIAIGAGVIVHESLHDTYLGHDKITPIMERIMRIR